MTLYVAHCDMPHYSPEQVLAWQQAAIAMCIEVSAWGRPVRFVRSLVVPSASQCDFLFEAEDGTRVRDVHEAAGIPFTQIVEAFQWPADG